jgi:(p)ppGpp synthase/HD superfamily hydrolase
MKYNIRPDEERPNFEDTLRLVTEAHAGQRDKGGEPYILHILRVALAVPKNLRIAALLHDIVEDTPFTLEDLRGRGYSEETLGVVDALTRREDETYVQFIERIKPNPSARKVKLADLADNMKLERLPALDDKAVGRLSRYYEAWLVLKDV